MPTAAKVHRAAPKTQRVDKRLSAWQRGYDSTWQKLRNAFIKRNPLCVYCMKTGVIKPAEEIDHIVPHKGDNVLRLSESNLQALCKQCHSRKTATEDGGFGHNSVPI